MGVAIAATALPLSFVEEGTATITPAESIYSAIYLFGTSSTPRRSVSVSNV